MNLRPVTWPEDCVLSETDLLPTPLHQTLLWLESAIERETTVGDVHEPTAMSLATVDNTGRPSVRTVFMRWLDGGGPGFVSFQGSRKSQEMAANGNVCALMGWRALGREIQFRGVAELIEPELLDEYWATRPRGSQITAMASPQTGTVASRESLDARWHEIEKQYEGLEIPRPDYFHGWRIRVREVEFLQMRDERLHDRILFTNPSDLDLNQPGWNVTRLMP